VVSTGGARGVTAESLVSLARATRPKLVLLGRTRLVDEPPAFAGASGDAALKRVALEEAKRLGEPTTPRAVGARVDHIVACREIRATLERLVAAGAEARYVSVDVRDPTAVSAALDDVRRAWGPIRAIVHGAGVLSDARLEKKTDEAFDRVFDTKVLGLAALLDATARDPLSHVALFSSVAARHGNVGQSDYAMANAVLDKVAGAIARERGPSCRVVSIGWGPWQGGMVTPALEKHFASHGVALMPPALAGDSFAGELTAQGDVEVAITAGGASLPGETRAIEVDVVVDRATYPQLESHRVQGKVVLPAVFAVDWFLRVACEALRAEPADLAVTDLHVRRGIVLTAFGERCDRFRVVGKKSADGNSIAFELRDAANATRYTATVERDSPSRRPRGATKHTVDPWTPPTVYGPGGLFHGPDFQIIRSVEGRAPGVAHAELASGRELGWPDGFWHTDPVQMDGVLQLGALFAYHHGLGPSLPLRIDRIACRAGGVGAERVACEGQVRDRTDDRLVCDFSIKDAGGAVVAEVDGLEIYRIPSGTS
jgi:NAD(P)-dependent dehydrogenase (short-subunit alcohol dehydrogenase family)